MGRFRPRRIVFSLAAPVGALLVALALSSVVLLISNINPTYTFSRMLEYGIQPDSVVDVLNRSTYYYLAAVAVAIGFRMNLFNIGVDGQYQLAAMFAAALGGAAFMDRLPGPLLTLAMIVVAVAVGAAWAGIAGVLKVTRGVSEVISTIMLNAVAAGLLAYFVNEARFGVREEGGNIVYTRTLPESSWIPAFPAFDFSFFGSREGVYGMVVVAVLVGTGYWVLINRTRFGFDLRAAGANPTAAVASGVSVKRMVLISMLLSGGTAGLVGLPLLLGDTHRFSSDFPAGIGFVGIAIALLGRNHPVGIAIGAVLWSFLDRSGQILDLEGIPREIVTIMQGVTVLAVVVAYEVVARVARRTEQSQVGRLLATDQPAGPTEPVPVGADTDAATPARASGAGTGADRDGTGAGKGDSKGDTA